MSHQYDSLWQRGWALSSLLPGGSEVPSSSRYNSSSLGGLAYETPVVRQTLRHPTHHRLRHARAAQNVRERRLDVTIPCTWAHPLASESHTCDVSRIAALGPHRSFAGELCDSYPRRPFSFVVSERSRSSLDPTLPSSRVRIEDLVPTEDLRQIHIPESVPKLELADLVVPFP